MKLRIQHNNAKQLIEIADDASLSQLVDLVESTINVSKFSIKLGFPPKLLDVSNPTASLKDSKIRSGESLIVEAHKPEADSKQQPTSSSSITPRAAETSNRTTAPAVRAPQARKKEVLQDSFSFGGAVPATKNDESLPPEIAVPGQGFLTLRVQPDDNSCLFRAIAYLCMRSIDAMEELRSLISSTIQANPVDYSDAVLGMSRDTYCSKMNRADTWGGEIEMKILSDYFNVQIASIDCKSGHIYRYGENFPECIYIVYSGIHYDALAMSPAQDAPPDWDQTQFPSVETAVEKAALELVAVLRKRNYFTDTANFDLRCNDCGAGLRGEKGAQEHAMKTNHVNFGEFKA